MERILAARNPAPVVVEGDAPRMVGMEAVTTPAAG
jgi:hypothetical protein